MKPLLQEIIDSFRFDDLPANWNSFDLESFSKTKNLWDYQQNAVKNAVKVLYKYFEDFVNYQKTESIEVNQERKQKFWQWYKDNGLDLDIDIKLDRRSRKIYNLLTEYYPVEDNKISYQNFISRMCFWMATGSGKSLVIVKLIHILIELMSRSEIPKCDILFLTHRDDLINQLSKHINDFNSVNEPHIVLKELKEYPEVKRQPELFGIPVFYYRSDNLSDEQHEKIIDFKNYDNDGKWYIFLDEAHKGDKEDSKRQHIYSILSRNGFLFNFSATFTDIRDVITCVYEFNLASFINAGYGKHISILKQEMRAFRNNTEDYSGEEKQKIVLKSLIVLTYVKKFYEEIKNIQSDLYHNPLLLTLVNSVNVEDADLKLFFNELEKIGEGKIEDDVFKSAINELWQEIKEEPEFMFEDGKKIKFNQTIFQSITRNDILKYVYNSKTAGEIEIFVRPSNKQEMAFKLKTSEKPFALVKIGDISNWLRQELTGYEINERFEDESYFETLNKEDSDINILMGSRSFYEGWDSNRPNVINYINIGVGENARKFILQSIGRGVRIEPIKNKRQRALVLYNTKEMSEEFFSKIKDKAMPLETLFVFGTNRQALQTVLEHLRKEQKDIINIGNLFTVNPELKNPLLIPVYKSAQQPIYKNAIKTKFEINKSELELLKKFIKYISDDRVLLMKYNTDIEKLKVLKQSIENQDNFALNNEKKYKNLDILMQRIFDYLGVIPKEFDKLKELEKEIRHFENIKVELKDITDLQNKIERVKYYPRLKEKLSSSYGKISSEDYLTKASKLRDEEVFVEANKKIRIKYIAHHYYLPVILSDDEKIDYIKHIIKTESEVKFINDLNDYLINDNNIFKEFDWWMFSKIDHTLDEIYIPYFNPNTNRIDLFYPDFIFWLKKGNEYLILFIDPKGTEHTAYLRKIDGYKNLFEKSHQEKVFFYNGFNVRIRVKIRPKDIVYIPDPYKKYAFDNIKNILS